MLKLKKKNPHCHLPDVDEANTQQLYFTVKSHFLKVVHLKLKYKQFLQLLKK